MKNQMSWLGGLAVAFTGLLLMGSSAWALEYEEVFEVTIKDQDFKYEETSLGKQVVLLPAGMEVNWMNVDPLVTPMGLEGIQPHGVKIMDETGNMIKQSPLLFKDNNTFTYKFTKPGVYPYICIVHPFMKGEFRVFNPTFFDGTTKVASSH